MKEVIWKMPFEISQEVWTIVKSYSKGWYVSEYPWEFCGVQQYKQVYENKEFLQAVLFDEENNEYCGEYYLNECFGSIEEAQRECDRRNNEEC